MKLLIVSHKHFYHSNKCFFARGGTPLEYNTLNQIFDELHILVHVRNAPYPPKGSQAISNSIVVHRIGNRFYARPPLPQIISCKVIFQTVYLIKRHRIDLLYGKSPSEIGMAGIFGASLVGIPRILRLAGDWLSTYALASCSKLTTNYRKNFLKIAGNASTCILPVSKEIANKLISLGIEQEKVMEPLYSPSITEDYFNVTPVSLDNRPKTLLFLGTLGNVKNIDGLLMAFKLFLESNNNKAQVQLQLVGDGPLKDNLKLMVLDLGLSGHVNFVGRVPHPKVIEYLKNAYGLILTSHSEGAPKVVMEAMAAGRPVIASSVGEIPNLVVDGVTGYLVNPDSERDISNKIGLLFSNPEKARAMGMAGRERSRRWGLEKFDQRIRCLTETLFNAHL